MLENGARVKERERERERECVSCISSYLIEFVVRATNSFNIIYYSSRYYIYLSEHICTDTHINVFIMMTVSIVLCM